MTRTARRKPRMPYVTAEHRRAAFKLLAMPGWTYERAMQDPLRRKLIECCAAHVRTRELQAERQRAFARKAPKIF